MIANAQYWHCTGFFVAKDVVMTAAHCVEDNIGKAGDMVYPLSLDVGYSILHGEKIQIKEAVVHLEKSAQNISIDIENADPFIFENPDFALLKLEKPYDRATPVAFVEPGEIKAGDEVLSASFGSAHKNLQRPYEYAFKVLPDGYDAFGEDYSDVTQGNTFEFMKALKANFSKIAPFFYVFKPWQSLTATLCNGDSGSLVYILKNNQVRVLGVASMFMMNPNNGNPECELTYLSFVAKTEPYLDKLKSEIAKLTQESK
jgi:hypothetical protein